MPRTRKKMKPAPVAKAKAKPKAAPVATTERRVGKRRGRRRGLLTGLGNHEHERDILDQYRGLPLTDLIGEGNVGLLTAARKFDPDQGVKFISYAVWWIRQAILAALARQGRTVRVPLNRTADLSRIVRTAEYLRQTLRREPTPEEIADATKLSLEVVQSLAALNTGDVRLDAPLDPDGDRSLIERFISEEVPDTEEKAMDRFLSDEIETALNTLQRRIGRASCR